MSSLVDGLTRRKISKLMAVSRRVAVSVAIGCMTVSHSLTVQ